MTKLRFSQAAPPADGFIEVTLDGYYQLNVDPSTPDGPDGHMIGDEWVEDFRFLRHSPFSETGALVASFSSSADGKMQVNQLNITRFLLRAVHPDDRMRLARLLDDQARVVTIQQISALAMALVEQQTGGKAGTTSPM